MSINLEDAVKIIINNVNKIKNIENVNIRNIDSRVCAKDVYANINIPPFNRSPLDGYALKSEDTTGGETTLKVIDSVYAGKPSSITVTNGTAVKIMTGAKIPKGANCVIRQEHTNYGDKDVTFNLKLENYENICFEGEDIKRGSLVVSKGEKLNYIHKGILASVGVFDIEVYKKPKVLLLISGDEVVESGPLLDGKIYDTNSYILEGRLKELGIDNVKIIYVSDNSSKITNIIKSNIDDADLIISTGGVSVGEKDFMPKVIEELGASTKFHGLNLKPGSPAMFSIYKEKPILSLSGNPFASLVTFEILAKPILHALTSDDEYINIYGTSVMGNPWHKKSNKERYLRAIEKDGTVYLPNNHSSGSLFSMKGCNCLIVIEEGNMGIEKGETVTIIKI